MQHNKIQYFFNLLKLVPADTANTSNYILINYNKVWSSANITFPIKHTKQTHDLTIKTLRTIMYKFFGDETLSFSSFYSGNNLHYITNNPINYYTLGYDPIIDVNAEIERLNTHFNQWEGTYDDELIGMSG